MGTFGRTLGFIIVPCALPYQIARRNSFLPDLLGTYGFNQRAQLRGCLLVESRVTGRGFITSRNVKEFCQKARKFEIPWDPMVSYDILSVKRA